MDSNNPSRDPSISKDEVDKIINHLKDNFCKSLLIFYFYFLIFAIFIAVKNESNITRYWKVLYVLDKLPEEDKQNIGDLADFYSNFFLRVVPDEKEEKPKVYELTEEEIAKLTKQVESVTISKPIDNQVSTSSSNKTKLDMAKAGPAKESDSKEEVKMSAHVETSKNISLMDSPVPPVNVPVLNHTVVLMPLLDFSD